MSHTARVGVFMLVALVVLGVFIIKIEEIPIGTRGGRMSVKAAFPSVAGLDEKSPVRIAGVRVGIVDKIDLEGDHAVVTLALDRGIVLHEGARAEVTGLGMLGDKYIELIPGPSSNPKLAADTVLTGSSPVGFDQLMKTVDDIGGDLKAVTASLRQSMGGPQGEKRLEEILENVRQLTASVRDLVQANRASVDATMANVRSFSESLKTELPRFADKLVALADHVDALVAENRGNIDASLGNVKEITTELRVSADNLKKITGKVASGEGSVGKLINEPETVDNLNSALKSGKAAADSIKNTIGRADRWRLNLNMRTESLPDLNVKNNSRSVFGIDLHTADRRFFRLEIVDSPVERESKQTETITTIYPDGHSQTVIQETTRLSDSNTINAQVGYHYNDYTFRAGLFESRGGVGIDRALLGNRLRLTLEAYDFNRDVKPPHLRFETRYFLTRNIFGFAGLDDPVWSQQRSVLLGGGVTWEDEDLKYLLGTLSSLGSGR